MLRFRAQRRRLRRRSCCLLAFATTAAAQSEVKSATLDAVKKRGQLICGVDTGIPGFAFQDSKGKWQGLDIAYCRAIADAILGSPEKVKYIGTTVEGALLRAAVGRDRRADPQFRLTHSSATPISAWTNRRSTSSPPGLHGEEEPGRRARQGPERRHDLPAHRHHAGDSTSPTTTAPTTSRSTRCCSTSPRRPSPPPMPGVATATPMTAARSRRRARRMKKPNDWMFLPETIGARSRSARSPAQGDEAWTRPGEVGALRDAGSRGPRHHQGQRRTDEARPKIPRRAASSAWKLISASCSASTTTGPIASSRTSATTATSTMPRSATRAASACRAA